MKIGLLDVDRYNNPYSSFPNIALMKFSTYHKNINDEVELYSQLEKYDIVYVSKVFDDRYSEKYPYKIQAKKIYYGGYGYKNYDISFIPGYEKLMPDYSLYNITDVSYGFLTKGCPRQCQFCVVGEIDGIKSYRVSSIVDWLNPKSNLIELCDPNILAYEKHMELLESLYEIGKTINFNQGLDIRFLNKQNVQLLKKLKIKRIHFAWDNPKDNLLPLFEKWRHYLSDNKKLTDYSKFTVYVLVNYNSSHEEDLFRVQELKKLGYDPYIMIFNKPNAPYLTRKLARWVNNKYIFRVCDFNEYNMKDKIEIIENGQQRLF